MEKTAVKSSPSPFNFWQGVLGRSITKGKIARVPSGRIGIMLRLSKPVSIFCAVTCMIRDVIRDVRQKSSYDPDIY